jgi:hypothetical protein
LCIKSFYLSTSLLSSVHGEKKEEKKASRPPRFWREKRTLTNFFFKWPSRRKLESEIHTMAFFGEIVIMATVGGARKGQNAVSGPISSN